MIYFFMQNMFNMTAVSHLLSVHSASETPAVDQRPVNISVQVAKARSDISSLLPILGIDSKTLWNKTGHHRRKIIKEVRGELDTHC